MQPYCPVPRSGDLVVLEVQELVGRHVVRKDIASLGLQHGREYDTVEHNVVFSYKVYHAGLRIFPVLLPVGGQLPCGGDISYGGIEPYIKYFALSTLDRYRYAPVEVTADGPGLKPLVEP